MSNNIQFEKGLLFVSTNTHTGAGAISIDTFHTEIVTTGANALTLADGKKSGQLKSISMITDGGNGTLTPANLRQYSTITFDAVGDTCLLIFIGTEWIVLSNNGCTLG